MAKIKASVRESDEVEAMRRQEAEMIERRAEIQLRIDVRRADPDALTPGDRRWIAEQVYERHRIAQEMRALQKNISDTLRDRRRSERLAKAEHFMRVAKTALDPGDFERLEKQADRRLSGRNASRSTA